MDEFQEIEVNGEIVEFPISMSDEDIAGVLSQQFPAPEVGMLGRMSEDLSQRGKEIGKLARGDYGQNIASDALQMAGQVAGAGLDVVGEGVGTLSSAVTPDFIEEPIKEYAGKVMDYTMEQPIVQKLVGSGMEVVGEHPEASRNIGAAFNIAGVAPMVKPAITAGKAIQKGAVATGKSLAKEAPITVEALKASEKAAYNEALKFAADTGAEVKTGGLRNKILNRTSKVFKDPTVGNIDPDVHPKAFQAINKLGERLGAKTIKPDDLENTRRLLGDFINASKDGAMDTPDTVKLYRIKDIFDEAVDDLEPTDFFKGNKEFVEKFKEARKISTVRRKVEPLDKIFRDAELHPKSSSFEVTLKNGFRSLAKNDKKMKMYTPEEQFLIRKAATTGNVEGVLNKFGVLNPFGSRIGAALGTGGVLGGAATANPLLAVGLPAVGVAAQAGSNALTRGSANRAIREISRQLEPQKPSLTDRAKSVFNKGN